MVEDGLGFLCYSSTLVSSFYTNHSSFLSTFGRIVVSLQVRVRRTVGRWVISFSVL